MDLVLKSNREYARIEASLEARLPSRGGTGKGRVARIDLILKLENDTRYKSVLPEILRLPRRGAT